MATKPSNVVLNFKMDGQVQYAETLKQINSVMNTAAKEYKNHIAAMGNDASATDKLRAEKKKLEIQMEGAQKRTKMLRAEYEAMAKDTNTTTDQLTAMYGKLLDSERAETSLQKAMDRVNEGLSDQAQEARDAKGSLDELKDQAKLLDAEQKNLTSSFKLQNAELGDNATEAEKTALAQKQLDAQMELTERAVKNLEDQLEATKTVYGENSVEVMQLETKLNDAKTTIKKFSDSLEGIDEGSDEAAEGMENLGKKIDANTLMEGAEALQAVSDKLIEIGTSAYDSALSFADAQIDMQSNLGLTNDEAVELAGVMEDVYKRGVVESVEEATEAVKAAYAAFGYLNAVELADLTDDITILAKRTGTDVVENVNAATKMMGAFKISEEEAFDLMAAGFQNGLNSSGDFLDTLNEYSPHFAAAGFSANEMLQIIENGMLNGSMNTDKAADAVKELQIRMGDGSFEKIMGSFSGETQGMFEQWKNGQATVSDVATSISGDLAKMTPTEQQAALSILSSQFEDLGVDGAAALFNVGDSFDVVNGKMDEMAQKTPSEELQASFRDLQTELLPLGQKLIEIAQDVLPKVIEAVGKLKEWFDNLSEPVKTYIKTFGGISAVLVVLSPVIAAIAAGFLAFGSTLAIVIGAIIAVTGIISGVMAVFKNWGSISDWLKEKFDIFSEWISELFSSMGAWISEKFAEMSAAIQETWNAITEYFSGVWESITTAATEAWTTFTEWITGIWTSITTTATEIWTGIVNVFTFIWLLIKEVFNVGWLAISTPLILAWQAISLLAEAIWTPIAEFFSGIWESIKQTFTTAWDAIMAFVLPIWDNFSAGATAIFTAISDFFTGIWNAIKTTFETVVSAIVNFVSEKFNALKSKAEEIFNAISSVVSSVWNSIKETISGVVEAISSTVSNVFNNVKSTVSNVFNSVKSTVSSIWESIKSSVSSAVNGISSTVSSVFNGVKNTISGIWDGIKNKITGAIDGAKNAVSTAVERIKSVMNFSWSLPSLKLPKFSVTGKFSLNPPSVPHLSVDWRAKGGIFTQPTIFGAANGRLQGIGEAGPEAALPLNDETLGAIGKGIAATMIGMQDTRPILVQIDGKTIATFTRDHIDKGLNDKSRETNFGIGRKG